VAESGIRTAADIDAIRRAGIGNFLIGESLVRADRPRLFLQALTSRPGAENQADRENGKVNHGAR
jgi:hypothetical protein